MRATISALAIAGIFNATALAAPSNVTVGSFIVTTDKDPFDESSTVIGMAVSNSGVFALRCIQSMLSVAVATQSSLTEGDLFLVKIRADNKTIFDEKGTAINNKIIEISDEVDKIFDEVSGAKLVSIRITGASSFTYTVPVWQSAKVVAQVKKACEAKPQ